MKHYQPFIIVCGFHAYLRMFELLFKYIMMHECNGQQQQQGLVLMC